MITFGNISIEISLIAVFVAVLTLKLLPIVAIIWFAVQGFRVHWGWGAANLLIPLAFIPFYILHPKESKRPLILIGIWLGLFLILWTCAGHGRSSRPRVEVAPTLSASAASAVLHLKLVSFNQTSQTGITISGILSRKDPVLPGGHSDGRNDDERLIAIQADGFVIQFTEGVGGEMRTNCILFPYGQTTETNIMEWSIAGDYSGKVASWPNQSPEPTADSTFRLLTTNGFTAPSVGGGSALGR
jgi:hypothetical protein